MANMDLLMNAKLADPFESIAMQSAEVLAAKQATGANLICGTHTNIHTFEDLVNTFKALAFDLRAKDPWEILGIPKYEGPIPSKDMVDSRVRDGKLLSTLAKKSME